jgi:hypothetical protein
MKTLADMTPQERTSTVGMWATVDTERYPAVIVRTYAADDVDYAQMLCPELNDYYTASLESITPRPDLPRAWNPDGTPPAGEWEDDYTDAEGSTLTTGEDVPGAGPHTHIRRFVSEWEEA